MSKRIQAIRGMNDVLPQETAAWLQVEATLAQISQRYGYSQIRFPYLEHTALFERTIGEVTDIVEKEMYTFLDRNGDSLTLRPEGTAGCVRAAIEQGLLHNQVQRLWYLGPMFRHERPQKGRYRQFHQFGVEAFGMTGPDIDAELIFMCARIWQELGVANDIVLHINSLGTPEVRAAYRDILVNYLTAHQAELDEDSQRRLHTNPLRILDSKNPEMQPLIKAAPQLMDYLDPISKQHFDDLRRLLDAIAIDYVVNPRLVRGLDYYTYTVFEWITDRLGSQGTVCAGGRYDGLVAQLGGAPTPAVGFAIGLERLIAMINPGFINPDQPDAYFIMSGEGAKSVGMLLAEQLRSQLPHLRLMVHCGDGSFKSQFKRADKVGATWALILGDDEVAANTISIKNLRSDAPQQTVKLTELLAILKADELGRTFT